jgi:hypothetical protein
VPLLSPLAADLALWRKECEADGPVKPDDLVFPMAIGEWSQDDWKNWRRRIFLPAAFAAGLPKGTRARDLRATFASLLIYEGRNVIEVARQQGCSPKMILDHYAGIFENYDPSERMPAEEAINAARAEQLRKESGTLAEEPKAANKKPRISGALVKPSIGLEPMTPSLPWKCSTN